MEDAKALLLRYWGHQNFREGQEDLVAAMRQGKDVLGVLPTGSGKSVCYQLPALTAEGLTVVITPLVALMEDQVAGLAQRGISATCLSAHLSHRDLEGRWNGLFAGRYRLLYVAPERLSGDRFRSRIEQVTVARLVVDEAHCISTWGHDFRPAYRQIPESRAWMGDPPTAAFTATATPQVRRDIQENLGLKDPLLQVSGFDRPEIIWTVFTDGRKAHHVADVLAGVPGAGVIYAATRRGVDVWAKRLQEAGIATSRYHAGLSSKERSEQQGAWSSRKTRIMVATSAFGMGIDRSDVRFVIHVDLPPSLDAYYQEAGRAGRDRKTAHAVLLTDKDDADHLRERLKAWHPPAALASKVYETLCSLAGVAIGSELNRPVAMDFERAGSVLHVPVRQVAGAVELLVQQEALIRHPGRPNTGWIRWAQSPADLLAERGSSTLLEHLYALSGGASLESGYELHLDRLARRAGISLDRARADLEHLAGRGVLEWQAPDSNDRFTLPGPRPRKPPVDGTAVKAARRRALAQADDMIRFAASPGCRRRWLLGYFGQASPDRCGACDDCLGRHEPFVITPAYESLARAVLEAVSKGTAPEKTPAMSGMPRYRRVALVDALIALDLLVQEDPFSDIRLSSAGQEKLRESS